MNRDYRILLDCHKDGYQAIVPGIKCGDSNTRTLYILLSDSGQPVKISENAIATIFVKKENGETVYGDCTIENDKIVHSIKTNEIDCEGEVCRGGLTGRLGNRGSGQLFCADGSSQKGN